jgi:hypothetical protein
MATTCDYMSGYILKNTTCVSCRLVPYSSGQASDVATCTCGDNQMWWSYPQVCYCPRFLDSSFYMNNGNCINCNLITDPIISADCNADCTIPPLELVQGICFNTTCPTGQIFNTTTMKCTCNLAANYANNGTACVLCSTVTGYTTGNCNNNCSAPFFFNLF